MDILLFQLTVHVYGIADPILFKKNNISIVVL
jgi:hypothetical protein